MFENFIKNTRFGKKNPQVAQSHGSPLNLDEECEVGANAISRDDRVILHSVITLIAILPPLSLYLDWSLLSGTRLHPRGFICDSLSSPTLPISHRCPPPFPFLFLTAPRSLLLSICLLVCRVCPALSLMIELELYVQSK